MNSSSFLPFTGDLAAFGLASENQTCIAVIPVKEEDAHTINYYKKNQKIQKEVFIRILLHPP